MQSNGKVSSGWLRDKEKSRGCFGDGLDVLFIVIAPIGDQQVVQDTHNAHEGQEGEDSFSKQKTRGAVAIKQYKITH